MGPCGDTWLQPSLTSSIHGALAVPPTAGVFCPDERISLSENVFPLMVHDLIHSARGSINLRPMFAFRVLL